MKAYLLIAEQGVYEDYDWWTVKIFKSKRKAENRAKKANDWVKAYEGEKWFLIRKGAYTDEWKKENPPNNPYDPKYSPSFWSDKTSYCVIEVEVEE